MAPGFAVNDTVAETGPKILKLYTGRSVFQCYLTYDLIALLFARFGEENW